MEKSETDNEKLVDLLNNVLADELVLNAKTRNYLWNISGSHVRDLHSVLRDQRQLIIRSMDRLARHILSLGGKATGILGEGLRRTRLEVHGEAPREASEMIEDLLASQRKLVHCLERDSRENRELLVSARIFDFASELLGQHRDMISTLEAIEKGRLHLQKDT